MFFSCFIECKNLIHNKETVDYLDSYVGYWSSINGYKSIDVVISKNAIEETVHWSAPMNNHYTTPFTDTTPFTASNLSADGENGLVVDISYEDINHQSKICKLTGHFRDTNKNTLVLQFHNEGDTFGSKFYSLYKHYY